MKITQYSPGNDMSENPAGGHGASSPRSTIGESGVSAKIGSGNESWVRRLGALRTAGPLIVLACLVVVVGVLSPSALSPRALASFSVDAAPLLLLVIGSTIPILIGGIDLSVAAMATIAGVSVSLFAPALGSWAVAVTLVLAVAMGGLQGYVHAKCQVPSFAVSLGTLGVLSGLAMFLTGASSVPIDSGLRVFDFITSSTLGVPNCVFVVLVVWLGLVAAMRYLKLGRHVYAIGIQERAAVMSGVDASRTRVVVFALSALCAAVAGVLYVSQTLFSSPTLAQTMVLPAIVGVVLGGTAISGGVGSIGMSMVGGLTAAFLRIASVVIGLPPTTQDIVYGVVVLAAVAVTLDREKLGIVK
ncbi:ABC transporter permease [Paraburkholderia nemoris]|uniref:ABC transporter permease n=1 Tax=Paraburkholderia nemoris TaxID=2793076 RepID=UPI001B202321|nr:ABC transporter permease [Paraburkholderia nemoris]CAE6858592.1 Ribose import permease protein RbsC [Paraburkholderia nemoris]